MNRAGVSECCKRATYQLTIKTSLLTSIQLYVHKLPENRLADAS